MLCAERIPAFGQGATAVIIWVTSRAPKIAAVFIAIGAGLQI